MGHAYHHIVLTSGISLLSSTHNVFRKWADELGLFLYDRTNPMPAEGLTESEVLVQWEGAFRKRLMEMEMIAKDNPECVSAEYSLLHSLKSAERLGPSPRVELIHTDSLGGRSAARLLGTLIAVVFKAQVGERPVDDIDPKDRDRLRQSLGGYMDTVAAALSDGDPAVTCFAPVGGYKVMTSLGYLVGAYMGFPTAYLHEDYQSLHEIPAVPVKIDVEALRVIAPMMRRLRNKGDAEWDTLTADEREMVSRHAYLFDRLDNLVGVNAFGQFLMDRPEHRAMFWQRVFVSPTVERVFQGDMGRTLMLQVKELLKKLKTPIRFRNELNHEAAFTGLGDTRFSLYKSGSRGTVFRAAYRYDAGDEALYLNRIWFDHDLYEREAARGIGLGDDPDDVRWLDRTTWIWRDKK
jgi:putative CRISPR-associated protein (TIGR02619 family)